MLAWLRTLPCEPCRLSGMTQFNPTEVEHWVTKARGGHDLGDTFPTCGYHRTVRHVCGAKTFQKNYPQRNWSDAGAEFAARFLKNHPSVRITADWERQ